MNPTTDALICTMEECGELVQACSKVIRIANDKQNIDKKRLAAAVYNLQQEIADVRTMLDILVEKELIDRNELPKMITEKRRKLRKWSPNVFK